MLNIAAQIAERRCPHCMTYGSLRLQTVHMTVVCVVCQRSYIDPFWEGPWDNDQNRVILDSVGGEVVSSYSAKNVETPVNDEDVEKMKAWADFEKYLREKERYSSESTRTD